MERFIGRKHELERMNEIYSGPGLRTCAIYGRRRIGKSSLISKFCENKDTINIQFVDDSESMNVEIIRMAIEDATGKDPGAFENLIRALRGLAEVCKQKRTILVFDELPFLTSCEKYIPSAIQRFIDTELKGTETFLIVCGSSIRLMKDLTEDPKRPLYGRFRERLKIGPLSLSECREFHPQMSDIDNLRTYMAVGGVPYYHEFMRYDTFRECIIKNFIRPSAPMLDESRAMIDRELSPSSLFAEMISLLAKGTNRRNELSDKMGISPQMCGKYLKQLESVGIAGRVRPMAGAPKHPRFRITDNLINFYYGAIEKKMSVISNNESSAAYDKIEEDIDSCFGRIFEDICSEHIKKNMFCKDIGKWWGRAGDEDRDVDLIAVVDENGHEVSLFCECKFRHRPQGFTALNKLIDTSEHVKKLSNRRFVIFSAFGFDEDLKDHVEQYKKTTNVRLIGIDELFGGG